MGLNDKIMTLIFGIIVLITGCLLYYREKKKHNVKVNLFFGYKFFKHYGMILIFFGIFLIFIAVHSIIYR